MSRGSSLDGHVSLVPGGPIRVTDGEGFALGMVETITGLACDATNRGSEVIVRGTGGTDDATHRCTYDGTSAYAWIKIMDATVAGATYAPIGSGANVFLDVTAGEDVQAAITYAEANGYSEILLGPGNHPHDGLTITKGIIFRGSGQYQTNCYLRTGASATTDNIRIAPTVAINNLTISDMTLSPISPASGRHAIHIDLTAAVNIGHAHLHHLNIAGSVGWGIFLTNGTANSPIVIPGLVTSVIGQCQISGGVSLIGCADSVQLLSNVIAGNGNGVIIDAINGAAALLVFGNNITAAGGLLIDGTHGARVIANYLELIAGYVASSPNGALLDLRGNSRVLAAPIVHYNTINCSADPAAVGIYVGDCDWADIDYNDMISGVASYDIEVGAAADLTHIGVRNRRYSSASPLPLVLNNGTNTRNGSEAAGSDTSVQYNTGGALAGDTLLAWNPTTKRFGVGVAPTGAFTAEVAPNGTDGALRLRANAAGTPAAGITFATADAATAWGTLNATAATLTLSSSSGDIGLSRQGVSRFLTNATETAINAGASDVNFRVIGDTATQLLVVDAGLDAVQIGNSVAGEIADFRNSGIVFNENGADRDLRVEGDTDVNLLTVDAGLDMVGIGAIPATKFDVNADSIRIRTAQTPATAGATGVQGEIAWDAGFLYVCVATNSWVRAVTAAW